MTILTVEIGSLEIRDEAQNPGRIPLVLNPKDGLDFGFGADLREWGVWIGRKNRHLVLYRGLSKGQGQNGGESAW